MAARTCITNRIVINNQNVLFIFKEKYLHALEFCDLISFFFKIYNIFNLILEKNPILFLEISNSMFENLQFHFWKFPMNSIFGNLQFCFWKF